jgi:hypothetical protein
MATIDGTTQNEPGAEDAASAESSAESLEEENRRLKEELERQREAAGPPRRHRVRRITAVILVVLTSLFALVGVLSVWVRQSVYNTSKFTAVVTPVANDPQVVDPLATYLTTQAILALGIQDRIKGVLQNIGSALPAKFHLSDRLGALAAPLTAAAQNFVHGRVQAFLHSYQFRQLFNSLVVKVHDKLVALIKGDYNQLPNVKILGPTVYLNTIPIIGQVLRNVAEQAAGLVGLNVTIPPISASDIPAAAREKLQSALGVTLPATFGLIPLMSSQKLHSYQTIAHRVDNLIVLILVLTVLFFALAIVVSPHRRRTLVQLGIGITFTFVLAAILLRVVVHHAIDQVQSPGAQAATRDVVQVMAHNLRLTAAWVFWPAVALAVIAYFVGRPRWAVRTVQWGKRVSVEGPEGSSLARFVTERYDWVVGGACGIALLLWFIVGIGWVSFAVIGVLLAAVIWWATALRAGERKRVSQAATPA